MASFYQISPSATVDSAVSNKPNCKVFVSRQQSTIAITQSASAIEFKLTPTFRSPRRRRLSFSFFTFFK